MATVFTANQATLVNNASQYRLGIVNAHQRKALMAYAKCLFLSSLAAETDYTANYPLLFSDSAIANKGTNPDAMEAALVWMEFASAENVMANTNNAATVPATLSAKLAACVPLLNQPDPILDQVILFLEVKINAALYNS